MSKSGIKLRYLSCASYEIVLPNGKHLITDPSYNDFAHLNGYASFSSDQIERCDYILLSHSHGDHTASIKDLCDRFESKVFLGQMVVDDMSKYLDMDYTLLYPMVDGQTYEFSDIKITAHHFRHNHLPKIMTRSAFEKRGESMAVSDVERRLNLHGSIECLDFCVTLENNLRLMIMAGKTELENPYLIAREFRPNIVIRQMFGAWTAEEYARALNRYSAQLALPNHQDACINKHGQQNYSYAELQIETEKALKEIHSATTFFCPEPYQWYDVSLGIVASPDNA